MKKNTIYILFSVLVLINIGLFIYMKQSKQKIYYVDLQLLYSEFELKKELEGHLTGFTQQTSLQLDSLALTINKLKMNVAQNKNEHDLMLLDQLSQVYIAKQEEFDLQKSKMAQQYDDQIWKQLNQYIKDYAKAHDCDFVMGGNGDGSVMYSTPSNDVTDEIIKYANEQYNGI